MTPALEAEFELRRGQFQLRFALEISAGETVVLVGPTMDPQARTWPRVLARWLRNSVYEQPSMVPLNAADYRDAGSRRVLAAFRLATDLRVTEHLRHPRKRAA